MAKENYLLKLSILEQEANKIQEQMQLINQQILELESLKTGLEKLNLEDKKKNEILAPLGKGIFVKSEIKESDLFVNLGSGIILKKKPKETSEIIEKQVKELENLKIILSDNIAQINFQLQNLVLEAQKEKNEE